MTASIPTLTDQAESKPQRARQALLRSLRPWLTLILVCALFSLNAGFRTTFWTGDYLPNIVQQSARNIVLAVGMSFVILTGGIDLSVGAVLALSGVGLGMALHGAIPLWLHFLIVLPFAVIGGWQAARRIQAQGTNARTAVALAVCLILDLGLGYLLHRGMTGGVKVEGAILIALLIGAGCGLINGLVVSIGRVPSFVATLGMLSAARGLTLYATDGSSVDASIPRLMRLGQSWPLALITLTVVALGAILLARSRLGRYIISIGGNETASHLSGVPVPDVKTIAYVLSGLAAAVGALLGGAPGVLSARWAGPEKDFAAAMARIHGAAGGPGRAWFVCALCLAWPGGDTATFLGRVDGTTCWPPRGERGFGYDPMFMPTGGAQTYGELDPAAKHAVSHRARAFAALVAACLQPEHAYERLTLSAAVQTRPGGQ